MSKIRDAFAALRQWARDYQPAIAATLAAAVFQLLVGLGITIGDWPDKVDAVLSFVDLVATLLAGKAIQRRVYSPATHRAEVRRARQNW